APELSWRIPVNLGIGIPTLVANYVPDDVHVFFQSENGLIGTGPIPEEGMTQRRLTDAGRARGGPRRPRRRRPPAGARPGLLGGARRGGAARGGRGAGWGGRAGPHG